MNKNDIFTFTTPNGVEITAVVVCLLNKSEYSTLQQYLCYTQNRLFTCYTGINYEDNKQFRMCGNVVVDYAILPDYDKMLEDYQHQLDMADDYASKEL